MVVTRSSVASEHNTSHQVVSGEDLATESRITGTRFNRQIYCLKVGSAQQVFWVHQQVLEQSPVLARMTNGGFSESITKEIILPEDDEDAFGRIIELLYGNENNAYDFSPLDEAGSVKKLADMFVLADKYDLFNIQNRVMTKLEEVKLLKENRMAFFNMAYQITQASSDSYENFLAFFRREAPKHLESLTKNDIKELSEMVESESIFSKWMLEAQANLYHEDQKKWSKEIKTITAEMKNREVQLVLFQKSYSASEAKLERVRESVSKFRAELRKSPASSTVTIQWVHNHLALSGL